MTDKTKDDGQTTELDKAELLKDLKQKATDLGIKFNPNITYERLLGRVEERLEEQRQEAAETHSTLQAMSAAQKRKTVGSIKEEALRLVRFRLIVNDPSLQLATGIHITAGNDIIGTVSRIIPTQAAVWHAEAIIVEHLRNRMYQVIPTRGSQGVSGNSVPRVGEHDHTKARLVPQFTIIELPPLTKEELDALARYQAENGTGASLDD